MGGFATNGMNLASLPLTGSEQIAADTQLGQGQTPQTEAVTVDMLAMFNPGALALTDGTTIATNAQSNNFFTVTLGGNRTLSNPTNLQTGQVYRWKITQDGTGARLLAFGTTFKFSGASTLTTTIGAIDMVVGVYDGTNLLSVLQAKFV